MAKEKELQPGEDYARLLPDVVKNRAAVAGERAVKEARTKFLPPLPSMCIMELENGKQAISGTVSNEGLVSYNKYLSFAYFYGATGRTVDGLNGLIYMKPAQVELPSQIEYMKENANGRGDSLRKLSETASIEAFISPRSGLLVDFPEVNGELSKADAEAQNIRPKILHYKFEDIYEAHFEIHNNELKLSMILLREQVKQRKQLEIEKATIFRLLEINEEGIYQQTILNEKGEVIRDAIIPMVNGQPSREIPFYLIEVGAEGKSVINDLVDANFNHYRFFADYAHKEHSSAFPIFYETGADPEGCSNIQIGPGAKWVNRNEAATFGVLQTSSDGGSMRQYLLDMEARMAALGAEMLKPRIAGAESAEAKSLDQVAQNSTVGSIAINVSEALQKALTFAARWMGATEEAKYSLNQDYNPKGITGQDLTALVSAWQSGGISYETFYQNLQKGEIASPNKSAEDEQQQILDENIGIGGGDVI